MWIDELKLKEKITKEDFKIKTVISKVNLPIVGEKGVIFKIKDEDKRMIWDDDNNRYIQMIFE